MILVLLGTHELPFNRLLREVEQQILTGVIREEVIVQLGNTKYPDRYFKTFRFIDPDLLRKYYNNAEYIITHAGEGSIMNGLLMNKKLIVCPRLKKYGEHNDDHQVEIATEFCTAGYILVYNDGDSLEKTIESLKTFQPNRYKSAKEDLIKDIENYINLF